MALTITIGGSTTVIDEGTLSIDATANGINTLTCDVTSEDGSIRPEMDDEVLVDRDSTRIFGGTITKATEQGFNGEGLTPITTRIEAQDFNALANQRIVFLSIPAGTLKAALTALLVYLTPYGVTLDPAQVDGPSIPALDYSVDPKSLAEVFADLETHSGYLRDISYSKVLGMYAPGSVAAPFNLAAGDGHIDGDLALSPSRAGYANRVWVRAGSGTSSRTQTWTATGSEDAWTTDTEAALPDPGYVTVGGVYCTVGTGAMFTWDQATHTLTRNSYPRPPLGTVISLTYWAQWPYVTQAPDPSTEPTAEQTAHGLWEVLIEEAELFEVETADAIAEDELAIRLAAGAREARYATYDDGLRPGQVQTINIPTRHVNAAFLITEVRARDHFSKIRYEVTAIEGTTYQGSWRDTYAAWGGGSTSTAIAIGSGASSAGHEYDAKNYGAKGDGVTDDTAAVAVAIAAVPAHGHLVFPEGTYLVSHLSMDGKAITLDGHGAIIQCLGHADGAIGKTDHGNKLRITGIRFTGVSPAIKVAAAPSGFTADDYAIDHCVFNCDATHPYAISLVGAREGFINRCTFIGAGGVGGVYLQSSVAPAITDCQYIGSDYTGRAIYYDGLADGYSCGLVVRACEVMGWDKGVEVANTDWCSITDSTIDSNASGGLVLASQHGAIVTGNYFGSHTAVAAVILKKNTRGLAPDYCSNVLIMGNEWEGTEIADYDDIYISDTAGTEIDICYNKLCFYTRNGIRWDGMAGFMHITGNTFVPRVGYGVAPVYNNGGATDSGVFIKDNRFPNPTTFASLNTVYATVEDNYGCWRFPTSHLPTPVGHADDEYLVVDSGDDYGVSWHGAAADKIHAHSSYLLVDELGDGLIPEFQAVEKVTDGGMEAWASATNLTNWTEFISGTSTVNRESVTMHGGLYSCRLDIDGSNSEAHIYQALTLTPGGRYHLRVWYKVDAGKYGGLLLVDSGGNVWLHSDGTWGAAAGIGLDTSGAWVQYDLYFVAHASYSNYLLYFGAGLNWSTATSSSVYFDDVSLMEVGVVAGVYHNIFDSYMELKEIAAPATPAAGYARLYANSNNLYWLNDAGVKVILSGDFGTNNTLLGLAGNLSISAQDCTLVGNLAGAGVTSGNGNTALGYKALYTQSNKTYATAVGWMAAPSANADYLAAFGAWALYTLTSGTGNCAVGAGALYAVTNTNDNTACGESALDSATGTGNTALGHDAGGANSGKAVTSGSYNVLLGWQTGVSTGTDQNSIAIGKGVVGAGSNTAVIGNADVTDAYFGGTGGVSNIHHAKRQVVIDSAVVTTEQTGVTALTDATATTIATIAMADGARTAGELSFTVEATDASADNDVATGALRFAAQRKGATVTCAIGAIGTGVVTKSHAGADMTVTGTADVSSGTSVVLKLNADTALTPTALKAHWRLTMLKGHGAIT